jgi:hypothetical protein
MIQHARDCRFCVVVVAAALMGICATPAHAQTTTQQLLDWGLDVYAKTVASLKVPGSALFSETAHASGSRTGGSGGFSFAWPLSTQFRVQTALARYDAATYAPLLRQFSDEARTRYWRTSGLGGYRSGVSSGSTLFYDDNAHMAVALVEAYRLTADPVYLDRAKETYAFVASGEDSLGGGGIYFTVPDNTVKETISTLQGARAAAMLYRETGEANYLADATRLYEWCRTHVQMSNGMFYQRYYVTGANAGTPDGGDLINGPGDAIGAQLELFAATGNAANLQEAQRLGSTSLTRFFTTSTGAIPDEGKWAYELVDALCELTRVDGNPIWRNRIVTALRWLHDNRRDPNGHYDELWGRGGVQSSILSSWELNDNAAVARSFLQAALTAPVTGDFNADGAVDADDLARWSANFGLVGGALLAQGDANRDRAVDGADLLLWQRHLGGSAAPGGLAIAAPEPASLVPLASAALAAVLVRRSRPRPDPATPTRNVIWRGRSTAARASMRRRSLPTRGS